MMGFFSLMPQKLTLISIMRGSRNSAVLGGALASVCIGLSLFYDAIPSVTLSARRIQRLRLWFERFGEHSSRSGCRLRYAEQRRNRNREIDRFAVLAIDAWLERRAVERQRDMRVVAVRREVGGALFLRNRERAWQREHVPGSVGRVAVGELSAHGRACHFASPEVSFGKVRERTGFQ